MKGAGADVWGTADAFHFAYEPLSGDGTIVARVATLQNVHAWVKAGVMIRATASPSSAHAFMIVSAAKGLAFQRRAQNGGTSASTSSGAGTAPHWVKLERRGDVFTAYSSPDGMSWTLGGKRHDRHATRCARRPRRQQSHDVGDGDCHLRQRVGSLMALKSNG